MLRRVLVPLDGSRAMTVVLPALRQLVGGTGNLVHLLALRPFPQLPARTRPRFPHADEALITRAAASHGAPEWPGPYLDELLLHERAVWLDCLARQGSQLAYDGVVVSREVRFGDPLAETLAAAERHAMHLIVLVAQAQTWRERLRRPNLAQRLLAHASVPVLTVPAERSPRQGVALRYDRVPV